MKDDSTTLAARDIWRLFESTPHPYLILCHDPKFTIVAVNDRYLAATGTRRSEIVGRGLFEVFPDDPDDLETSSVSDLRTSLDRVRREGVQDVMGVQKYDIPNTDGSGGFSVKYWSPVNTPVFSDTEEVAFIIHHVEDVTEFILAKQRDLADAKAETERAGGQISRMEAEILRRASEVKEANRQLKAANEALEIREAELARLNERLREADRLKTEFFSNVSHEFRTPLTLMLGPLEQVLARPAGVPDEIRAALDLSRRNALRLLKLVNTLLDFSRLEAGRAQPNFAPVDLAALTLDLASAFRSACEMAGLDLVVDCPALPQPVHIDVEMWEKVVLNLLSNAFKFTFAGEIAVTVRAEPDHAAIVFRDTGVGIPAKELPHVFERFHRVEGVRGRSHEGTGIGLALVRELVALQGGDICVDSVEGEGTRFCIRLPFGTAHLPASPREGEMATAPRTWGARSRAFVEEALRWLPGATPLADNGDGGTGRGRIVIADDNWDMRDYVRGLLEAAGYVVAEAGDGGAALAACLADPPDLILSDVMMPGIDGFTLVAKLRADQRTSSVPVILLSARAGEEARIGGLAAGADDYLVKPFGARELIARVDAAIRLSRARNEVTDQATAAAREAKKEQHRLDAVLRRRDEEIRKLSLAVEQSPESIVITDLNATIEYVNDAFLQVTGYSRDELIGQNLRFLQSGKTSRETFASLWEILAQGRVWKGEFCNSRKDGSEYFASAIITPISQSDGTVTHYLAIQQDITERKRLADELDGYRHHLEALVEERTTELIAANRELDSFAYAVSHDLRAPLRAMAGFAGALMEDFGQHLDDEAKDFVGQIDLAARKMGELIEGLLVLSRSTRGELLREPVDISALAVRMLAELSREAPGRSVGWHVEPGLAVIGDPRMIEAALRNLVENAWKYTARVTDPTIRVFAGTVGGLDGLCVADNGAGFDMQYAERLFKPFQRLHRQDEFPGIGIGLATVQRIVRRHGGQIRAEGRPGEGAVFCFTLSPPPA